MCVSTSPRVNTIGAGGVPHGNRVTWPVCRMAAVQAARAPDYPPRVAPQLPAQLPAAKGKMGENGGKWGEMGKPREIVGKLVEEHGKNIQLSTKVAKFWQTRYSPFSSISPDFSSGMLLNTPPPPKANKKWFFGLFTQRCPHFSTKNRRSLTVRPISPHFPYSGLFRRHYRLISGSGCLGGPSQQQAI